MMSAISEFIKYQETVTFALEDSNCALATTCEQTLVTVNKLITLRKNIELKSEIRLPCWFIPFLYTGGGALFIICIPTILFVLMERWTILESIYFGKSLHELKEFQSYNKLVL